MKILYLVVCAEMGDYVILADGIRETWGKDNPDVFYLWCREHLTKKPNDWVLDRKESYGEILWKMIKFLESYTSPFDYVVKTNPGCYINIPALHEWLSDKPRTRFYAGAVGHYSDAYGVDCDFVGGGCIILSEDLARLMVSTQKEFGPAHIDDVAIGMFAQRCGVVPTLGQRAMKLGDDAYHYYLRSGDGERWQDVEAMKILDYRFKHKL